MQWEIKVTKCVMVWTWHDNNLHGELRLIALGTQQGHRKRNEWMLFELKLTENDSRKFGCKS